MNNDQIQVTDFIKELNRLICCAFDNEEDFIKEFLPKSVDELVSFYMASDRCHVMFSSTKQLMQLVTTIPTDEYISWANKIQNGEI
jgi:hypothetical protein